VEGIEVHRTRKGYVLLDTTRGPMWRGGMYAVHIRRQDGTTLEVAEHSDRDVAIAVFKDYPSDQVG